MDYVGVGAINCCQRRSYRIVGVVRTLGLSLRPSGVEAIGAVGIGKCGVGSIGVGDGVGAVGV